MKYSAAAAVLVLGLAGCGTPRFQQRPGEHFHDALDRLWAGCARDPKFDASCAYWEKFFP